MSETNNQHQTPQTNPSRKERLLLSNPTEVASVVRNQSFVVQNELSLAGQGDDAEQPLKVYSVFSRFVFSIINAERKSVISNLRVEEIAGIACATEYAYRLHMDSMYQAKPKEVSGGDVDTSSPAFTKRLVSGTMKGKTPVEVILEAEDKDKAAAMLNNQYKWLKENAERNPKYAVGNREQMAAIAEAARLHKAGKLTADVLSAAKSAAAGMIIPLYAGGCRPLRSRQQRNGKTFVYELKIDWNVGSAYPVVIEIRNYYAPVTQKETGQLNVQIKQKQDELKCTMALSAAEWQHTLYMLQTNMRMFETRHAYDCYKFAQQARFRARRVAEDAQNH